MSHLILEIRYRWQEGSCPPPYHYDYTIRVGPGLHGEIKYRPDYGFNDPPVWNESFNPSARQLASLSDLMHAKGFLTGIGSAEQGCRGVANRQARSGHCACARRVVVSRVTSFLPAVSQAR
jgi:hypothetical protein